MTHAEAELEKWLATHGRHNTTADLVHWLQEMADRLIDEADAEQDEANDRRRDNPLEPDFRRIA